MSNPAAPAVEITLDRPRKLLYDFNALAAAEEALGESVLDPQFWTNKSKAISARRLRGLLWAGLRHEDPELTLEDVGKLITFASLQSLLASVLKAWEASMPESDPTSPATMAPPEKAALGSTSGLSGATTSRSAKRNSGG